MNNTALGYLFNVLAFGVGAFVYWSEAKRRKLHPGMMRELALVGALAGIVAAALTQWVVNAAVHGPDPQAAGGRTIIGGVLGGWLGVELTKRRLHIPISTGPLWALAIAAGEAVGRIGCWFHGCCYGKVCALPWAVWQHDAWRHPTQFYLSGAAALSFLALWRMRDRADLFLWGLLFWSLSRVVIEPLRASSSQAPGLAVGVCALVFIYAVLRLTWSLFNSRKSAVVNG